MPLRRFTELLKSLDLEATGKWFLLSAFIGVVAGLGAIVFQVLSQAVMHFALTLPTGFQPGEARGEHPLFEHVESKEDISPWLIVVVMTGGGLAAGFLVAHYAPEAEGHGTDAAIDAFHRKGGMIRGRVPIIKTLASAITIGTGGSGGREGPIAQIGGAFGSFLATRLRLSARDRRIMLAAGMGAGVGAIFRAPLAGACPTTLIYGTKDTETPPSVGRAIHRLIPNSEYIECPEFGHISVLDRGRHQIALAVKERLSG